MYGTTLTGKGKVDYFFSDCKYYSFRSENKIIHELRNSTSYEIQLLRKRSKEDKRYTFAFMLFAGSLYKVNIIPLVNYSVGEYHNVLFVHSVKITLLMLLVKNNNKDSLN